MTTTSTAAATTTTATATPTPSPCRLSLGRRDFQSRDGVHTAANKLYFLYQKGFGFFFKKDKYLSTLFLRSTHTTNSTILPLYGSLALEAGWTCRWKNGPNWACLSLYPPPFYSMRAKTKNKTTKYSCGGHSTLTPAQSVQLFFFLLLYVISPECRRCHIKSQICTFLLLLPSLMNLGFFFKRMGPSLFVLIPLLPWNHFTNLSSWFFSFLFGKSRVDLLPQFSL